jgi:conjugative relaxase-like TrwC/TraI family protein
MVATISAISSSAQASSYYEADDYYAGDGLSPSEWQGAGADALGLSGEVERDQFREMLDGKLTNGQQLGTIREGANQHRPGWDVTMSAPKSVSIMAEVAGDRRLVGAHDRAVKSALAFAERHTAAARIRDGGTVERQQTGNLTIASFRHDTSRAQDPQLHTHNVIMNATRDADGNWRSLEPRALYQLQKTIGAVYRQELAVNVRGLGYEIEAGKDSLFEIKGVSADVIRAFSERAAQVEARLAERGQTRETASAAEKQIAALDTRAVKESVNRADLIKDWRVTADGAGFDQAARLVLVAKAEMAAAQTDHALTLAAAGEITAHQAVAFSAEKLGERQSVFSTADLEKEAGRFGLGTVTQTQIGAAIDRATKDSALASRTFIDKRGAKFGGFTTAANIDNERRLLRAEANGRGSGAAIQTPMQAAKAVASAALKSEHTWTPEQRDAAKALLTSQNRVTAVQGYAGTAKTTTVLATFAREAESLGINVTALAPTASAARTLGEALGTQGETVAKHLMVQAPATANGRTIWIVDEASILSARDTATLLESATKANARVVLVGDVKQLGSVGAGAAFAQLQGAGMETAKLAEIVRQTNPLTKEAVEASIQGDARRALDGLDRGGGKIIAFADPTERMQAMAKDYAALSAKDQRSTIVIDPSREGRDALNADIRTQLISSGRLTGEAVTIRTLESKGLTRAEARDARSYEVGDVVRFARDYADKGIAKREAATVTGVDPAKNAVSLEKTNGQVVDWRPRQWGASKSETFTPGRVEMMKGDRIEFTRNDRTVSRENGGRAQVVSVKAEGQTARIRLDTGKFQTLDLTKSTDQHLRHGYVQTAHAAQGRTAERVMIHADSRSINLVDQKMMYVGISRARVSAAVYTDDRAKLVSGIMERAGEKQVALGSRVSDNVAAVVRAASKSAGAGLG